MGFNRKVAALVVALLASLGMVAVAAPVSAAVPQVCQTVVADDNTVESQTCVPERQKKTELARWGYCPYTFPTGKLSFLDLQGWCGDSVLMNAPTAGQCRYMGAWDNWAGSMGNNTEYRVTLWQAGNCTGTLTTVGNHIYEPNLYDYGLGNAVSTIALP